MEVIMKGRYEIRIYNERFNIDQDYYTGNEDIKLSVWCGTPEELKEKWEELLDENEGETYSIWDHTINDIIVGGAYDPNDYEIIDEYFETEGDKS